MTVFGFVRCGLLQLSRLVAFYISEPDTSFLDPIREPGRNQSVAHQFHQSRDGRESGEHEHGKPELDLHRARLIAS